eukprot:2163128-Pleurochrysis_carterae.AAC.2
MRGRGRCWYRCARRICFERRRCSQVSGAPQAFVEAQGERGAPRFRLYNPSLVHAHGNTVQARGTTPNE